MVHRRGLPAEGSGHPRNRAPGQDRSHGFEQLSSFIAPNTIQPGRSPDQQTVACHRGCGQTELFERVCGQELECRSRLHDIGVPALVKEEQRVPAHPRRGREVSTQPLLVNQSAGDSIVAGESTVVLDHVQVLAGYQKRRDIGSEK